MSFYEELLTFGGELHEAERIALFKYLLETKKDSYRLDAIKLVNSSQLKSEIANGEIAYSLNGDIISFSARKKGKEVFHENLRSLRLSRFSKFKRRKIIKFFAQCEVDVIWNYPLQGDHLLEDGSFTSMTYPYFDFRYFAEGKGPIVGFIKKFKSDDSEILYLLKSS
jgi:hypothetical protein